MRLFKCLLVVILSIISIYYPLFFILLAALLLLNFKKEGFKLLIILSLSFLVVTTLIFFTNFSLDGTYLGLITQRENNYVIIQTFLGRFYLESKDNTFAIGDILKFSAKSSNYLFSYVEKSFNFNKFLGQQGIKQKLNYFEYITVFRFPLRNYAFKEQFYLTYSVQTKTLVEAFIFNNKDYSTEIIKNFQNIDLIFLLSSSGIHLHLFMFLISSVFGLFTTKKIELKVLPLLFIIPLWFLNLDKFIFYKIFLVKALTLLNEYKFKNKHSYLSTISFSAIVFLVINPLIIFNMSFYISYGLSFLIHFVRPILVRTKKSFQPLVLSGSIFLFLLPIRIAQTNFFMPLTWLLQLAVAPLLGLYFIFAYLSIFMGGRGAVILNPYSQFLVSLSKSFELFNFGLSAGDMSIYLIVFSLLLGVFIVYSLEVKHKPFLNYSLSFLTIITFAVFTPIKSVITESVTFINVGQGDATLIQFKNIEVLIDTGGSKYQDIAKDSLIPYFRSRHINNIDAVIITHDDFDHNGALTSLQANFKVKQVITDASYFPLKIGNLIFHNLNDGIGFNEDNEKSLVIYLEFMNKKWLFMGDASTNNEQQIIRDNPDLDIDVLKVGHHGSKTSTSLEFLASITPDIAIISAGINNIYRHPHKEVIENLNSLAVVVRRTDLEGTISYQNITL